MFNIGKINTKKDHLAELKAALSLAVDAAHKAGVPFGAILHTMEARAAHLRNIETAEIEKRQRATIPTTYDPWGNPIDGYRQAARAEEERRARELREQQRQYAESVQRRAEEDAVRNGKVPR